MLSLVAGVPVIPETELAASHPVNRRKQVARRQQDGNWGTPAKLYLPNKYWRNVIRFTLSVSDTICCWFLLANWRITKSIFWTGRWHSFFFSSSILAVTVRIPRTVNNTVDKQIRYRLEIMQTVFFLCGIRTIKNASLTILHSSTTTTVMVVVWCVVFFEKR